MKTFVWLNKKNKINITIHLGLSTINPPPGGFIILYLKTFQHNPANNPFPQTKSTTSNNFTTFDKRIIEAFVVSFKVIDKNILKDNSYEKN